MMNRIYKVVWSQVKNCYTVVSEIANSHIRGGNRSRMGVAMLAVAVLTGCLGMQSTSAEAVKVQAGKNTTVVVTTDASTGDKIYTVNAADDAIVYEGEGDTKALKSTNASAKPQGENAIALGRNAWAEKEKSISIGDGSHASEVNSIAIGDNGYAGYENAIAIGSGASANDVSTVAIGADAEANSMYTISIGKESEAYFDAAIAIGQKSNVDATRGIALGAESANYVTDGVALGSYSYVYASAGVSGYDFYEGKESVNDSAVWKSTLGSISVGDTRFSDDLKTRQITGVAAGTEDTDVVNVAQLKQVADQVKSAKVHYYSVKTTPDTDGKSESNYANDGATGINAMAMGVYAKASGFAATAIGYESKAIGTNSVALMGTTAHGTNAMTWGDVRNVSGAAVETKYFTNSDYGVKLPYAVKDADGFYVMATGDAVASYKNATAFGSSNVAANDEATAFGRNNLVMGSAGTAWGANNYIDQDATLATSWGDSNYVYGHNATAWGEDNYAISVMATTWGRDNRVSGEQGTAFGWGAEANGENATAWGYYSKAFAENATAFGDHSNAYGANSLAVLGGSTGEVNPDVNGTPVYTGGANAMAVGKNAVAKLDDSIALGSGAVADRGKGTVGYDALGAVHDTDQSGVWKSTMNAVSVGNAAGNITRQITGVAAGSEDTDAVNVAQLKQVNSKADQAVEAASKGWNISTNGVNQTKVTLGDTVDFTGDSNIGVSNNGKQVKVELNKTLTGLESVTSAKAYVTSVDANDKNSVTNVGYVKSQVADASLGAGKGISITDKKIHVKLKDGEENLTVDETGLSMKKDLTGMQSINGAGGGKISFAGGNVTVNKNTFASDGRIQNVTAGMADTDAVNVAQLKSAVAEGNTDTHIKVGEYSVGTGNKVAMDVVDKTGKTIGAVTITDVAKASDVGNIGKIHQDLKNKDGSKTTVVDAVNNLNNKVGDLKYSAVTKGDINDGDSSTTAIGKLNQKLSDVAAVAGQHSSVSTTDANIQIQEGNNAAGGKDYALSLNKNQQLTSVTTGETKMDTNGIKVGDKVTLTKDGLSAGDTKITYDGLSIGDKTYVTKDGLNANGNKVTQVADGKVEKGSKDAVNGGQLYNTNQMVINNANNISSLGNALGRLDHRVNKVGAGAAALAALHSLDFDPDEKWDFAAGYGNYNGVNAAAIGAYYRPNEDTMFSVGGSFGNGENMVNAGVSVKLGQGNHVSTSKVAMAKEIKDLRKEVEALKSALLDVHAGRKWNTSKLQLFPDVSQNHWAYEQISILKANGVITGYPDGKYEGERPMTRYEFATMLFRAMEKGAVLSDRMLTEFAPELERFTVDAVHTDKDGKPTVERVRIAKTKRS